MGDRRRLRRQALPLAVVLLGMLAACSAAPTPTPTPSFGPHPHLGIANGTTLTVTLVVNGERIGDSAPDSLATIELSALPALPWNVEARTSSGRVLTSILVAYDSVGMTTPPEGTTEPGAVTGRVDLSCGRLLIWAGNIVPRGGPMWGPGTPGDCVP